MKHMQRISWQFRKAGRTCVRDYTMAETFSEVIRKQTKAPVQAREPVRKLKPGEVLGRNGEVLARHKNFDDPYVVPEHLKEDGWTYQWCRQSTYGKEDRAEQLRMQDNGWRPVPPSRFGHNDTGDYVVRDGLVLMERPVELTEAARSEEAKKAKTQYLRALSRTDTDVKLSEGELQLKYEIKRGQREVVDNRYKPMHEGDAIPGDE